MPNFTFFSTQREPTRTTAIAFGFLTRCDVGGKSPESKTRSLYAKLRKPGLPTAESIATRRVAHQLRQMDPNEMPPPDYDGYRDRLGVHRCNAYDGPRSDRNTSTVQNAATRTSYELRSVELGEEGYCGFAKSRADDSSIPFVRLAAARIRKEQFVGIAKIRAAAGNRPNANLSG